MRNRGQVSIEGRYLQFNNSEMPTAVQKYLKSLTTSVRDNPSRQEEGHIAAVRASPEERRHWIPLVSELDFKTAEKFVWKGESGLMQSYQSQETQGWLHIAGGGWFYDRYAHPISREAALQQAGLTISLSSSTNNQSVQSIITIDNPLGASPPREPTKYAPIEMAMHGEASAYEWKHETGEIQSYRHNQSGAWLHIDRQGQFYDRQAQPVSRESALDQVRDSGSHSMNGHNQSQPLVKPAETSDRGFAL